MSLASTGELLADVHVAVVGAGPSGFYAAEALLALDAKVTLIERLPAPFGLVRYGVAPDHPKLKQTITVFDRVARRDGCGFISNVRVGTDVSVEELQSLFDAVVFAHGASHDRALDVPGEALAGSHSATDFVGWYNGHPDFCDQEFDLSHPVAVVCGNGNVALDVARMLLKPVADLEKTDIAAHALDALRASRVREVHIVGRRGPVQSKFSTSELRELTQLEHCKVMCDPAELLLNEASEAELAHPMSRELRANLDLLRSVAQPQRHHNRQCRIHFQRSPASLVGADRVTGIRLRRTLLQGAAFEQRSVVSGDELLIDCGLVFRAVGYKGVALAGLPFDLSRGVVPTIDGRVVDANGNARPGLYATGWIKRGPSGVIGTNRADSVRVVRHVMEDIVGRPSRVARAGAPGLRRLLCARGCRFLDYDQWSLVDRREIADGEATGKPREKFTRVAQMLAVGLGDEHDMSVANGLTP